MSEDIHGDREVLMEVINTYEVVQGVYLRLCVTVGTVDNNGNTEIMETVIFVKCCECRDFAKVPCFLPKCHSVTFSQKYFVFNQHNLKFIV